MEHMTFAHALLKSPLKPILIKDCTAIPVLKFYSDKITSPSFQPLWDEEVGTITDAYTYRIYFLHLTKEEILSKINEVK